MLKKTLVVVLALTGLVGAHGIFRLIHPRAIES